MKYPRILVAAVAALLLASPVRATPVNVFAAASLTDALKQIAVDYEKTSGDHIAFNFAASGPLARQIEAGAPADVFISADEARADELAGKGLLVTGSRRSLLGNTLVIVTPPDNTTIHTPTDLTNSAVKRIALGDPKSVPCGTYSRQYFDGLGVWPLVAAKMIPCENVRSVLATVETGDVDAGIVYKTDAAVSKNVKVVYEVPVADGPKITYPAALVSGSSQTEAAQKFLDYLSTPRAQKIFRDAGFVVLDDSAEK
jgi:molybdate transport system substrate-binding protein